MEAGQDRRERRSRAGQEGKTEPGREYGRGVPIYRTGYTGATSTVGYGPLPASRRYSRPGTGMLLAVYVLHASISLAANGSFARGAKGG